MVVGMTKALNELFISKTLIVAKKAFNRCVRIRGR